MFVVGLTGGIGSGKSVVAEKFHLFDILIVDADIVAREVVEPGKPCLEEIEKRFGSDILTDKGVLNRPKLREIIFSDEGERTWLESLLHPKIGEHINEELNHASSAYSILVSPLLLETQQQELCSRILVVDVPEELQIKRTLLRDKVPREQVEKIMNSQMKRKERLQRADDIISNTGTKIDLENKVLDLHQKYVELSK